MTNESPSNGRRGGSRLHAPELGIGGASDDSFLPKGKIVTVPGGTVSSVMDGANTVGTRIVSFYPHWAKLSRPLAKPGNI